MASTLGKYNPFRYRGYVYDEETGLYYLNSRYYDPKVGRFICADGYSSTGQGLLGMNAFAYCGNEPVDRMDIFGCFYDSAWAYHQERQMYAVAGIVHPDEYIMQVYSSKEDAINAFYANNYNKSMYTRIEMGAEIFSIQKNGKTAYGYTEPRFGDPHGVGMYKTPAGKKLLAFVHIHPNSDKFSDDDKALAVNNNIDVYVSVPNQGLKVLDPLGIVTDLPSITNVNKLSTREKEALIFCTKAVWDAHIESMMGFDICGFDCAKKSWPNNDY